MFYYEINEVGRQSLIAYLKDHLRQPEHAERHADVLIAEYDGSDFGAPKDVEIRGFYTRDGIECQNEAVARAGTPRCKLCPGPYQVCEEHLQDMIHWAAKFRSKVGLLIIEDLAA